MSKSRQENFTLSGWLLKKLSRELIVWYSFTFLASFFYYQAVFSLKNWGYEKTVFPHSLIFGTFSINSRSGLLFYSLSCFLLGGILISLVADYLGNYTRELCRFYLRKLILQRSAKNPSQTRAFRTEILSNFLSEVELFIPLFIISPQKVYAAVINIILNFIFLTNFRGNELAIHFVLVFSLLLALLSFLTYAGQKKINQKLNQFRQRENATMEKYLSYPDNSQSVGKLINRNWQKSRYILLKKTLSILPTLFIAGSGMLFCFLYSYKHGKNWEIENFVEIGLIAGSIQVIFWKVKDITDNLPEISKIQIHYKSLSKLLKKMEFTSTPKGRDKN